MDIEKLRLTGTDLDKIDLELSTPFVLPKVNAVIDAQLAKALWGIEEAIHEIEQEIDAEFRQGKPWLRHEANGVAQVRWRLRQCREAAGIYQPN